jgi:hypothetical protein
MVKAQVRTRAVVTRTVHIEVSREDILDFLRTKGFVPMRDARVYFSILGGGDWSNMEAVIGEDGPIRVEWSETSEEGGSE